MKKKLIHAAVFLLISFTAGAQLQPGAVYPGISVTKNLLTYNANAVRGELEVGLSKHNSLGLFLRYTRYINSRSKDSSGFVPKGNTAETEAGLSFSSFRYFNKRSKWGTLLNAEFGISKINVYEDNGSGNLLRLSYHRINLSITPGIFYAPSPKVMLVGNIGGFTLSTVKNAGIEGTSDIGQRITLGARFTLGGKKKNNALK